MAKEKSSRRWIILLIIIILLLLFFIFGGFKLTGNVVRNTGCKEVTKYKTEYKTETYQSSSKGCDNVASCTCLHKSWAGLGTCDSCNCVKQVAVQIPYTVEECAWDD
mgnify:CR=1 FL=1